MKKIIAIAFILLVGLFILSGCKPNKIEPITTEQVNNGEAEKIQSIPLIEISTGLPCPNCLELAYNQAIKTIENPRLISIVIKKYDNKNNYEYSFMVDDLSSSYKVYIVEVDGLNNDIIRENENSVSKIFDYIPFNIDSKALIDHEKALAEISNMDMFKCIAHSKYDINFGNRETIVKIKGNQNPSWEIYQRSGNGQIHYYIDIETGKLTNIIKKDLSLSCDEIELNVPSKTI